MMRIQYLGLRRSPGSRLLLKFIVAIGAKAGSRSVLAALSQSTLLSNLW
jgi:hypothetical protein